MLNYDHIPKNYFDRKRDEFLASIYEGHAQVAEHIYKDVSDKVLSTSEFSEVELKAIYQIQHAFRTLYKPSRSSDIHLLYTRTRKGLAHRAREETKHIRHVDYDAWRRNTGLSENQLRVMFQTVCTLQITVGCSNYCRRCNEWALPGPRKHFTFDAVQRLIKKLLEAGNTDFAFYSASDPMDWAHEGKNMIDIWKFMETQGFHPRFGLLTKIPRGSEKMIETLLKHGADIGFSIIDRNREQVENMKKAVGKTLDIQHDFDALLIPAGRDDDFMTTKPSITDNYGTELTPEGAFLVIPTFTSPLNPTGQRRIPVTADTDFFLKNRVGRDALPVKYFKPLQAIDLNSREFTLERLFEPQIENILLDKGSEAVTPPGMMNMREYFKTYEPEAVKQRKRLLPAVAREQIKGILSTRERQETSQPERYSRFGQDILDYDTACRTESVMIYKKNAFTFYLKSIADYLKSHSVEKRIIAYLRRKGGKSDAGDHTSISDISALPLDSVIERTEVGNFDLFQTLIIMLMEDPENSMIRTFIAENPAGPKDRFL